MISVEENALKKSKTVSSKTSSENTVSSKLSEKTVSSLATSFEEDIDTQNNIFTFAKASVKKLTKDIIQNNISISELFNRSLSKSEDIVLCVCQSHSLPM